jgi:RNA polymerase sigma-70 factor (sigma-E family)
MDDTFAEFVTARGAGLLRFAFVLCGDRHLAEDLVQSVLARMHRRWKQVEAVDSPDAYIRASIVNEFLSWHRRLSSRELVVAELPERAARGPSSVDTEGQTADRDEMWRLLATLPRTQRVVLTLRFYEDMSYDEIARVLGSATSTVRVHASRGLARLRLQLDPESDPTARNDAEATGGRHGRH